MSDDEEEYEYEYDDDDMDDGGKTNGTSSLQCQNRRSAHTSVRTHMTSFVYDTFFVTTGFQYTDEEEEGDDAEVALGKPNWYSATNQQNHRMLTTFAQR